jgi:hypothetical protein
MIEPIVSSTSKLYATFSPLNTQLGKFFNAIFMRPLA